MVHSNPINTLIFCHSTFELHFQLGVSIPVSILFSIHTVPIHPPTMYECEVNPNPKFLIVKQY